MPVNITEEFVRQLMAQVDFLTKQNNTLAAIVDSMNQTIAELNQTIRELKEQLNKNSKNSSKPPSSDGLKKLTVKKDRSLRESSGKKQGLKKVMTAFISLLFQNRIMSRRICTLTVPVVLIVPAVLIKHA